MRRSGTNLRMPLASLPANQCKATTATGFSSDFCAANQHRDLNQHRYPVDELEHSGSEWQRAGPFRGSCGSTSSGERFSPLPSISSTRRTEEPAMASEFEKKVLRSLNVIQLRLAEHSEQLDAIAECLQQPCSSDTTTTFEQLTDVESFLHFDDELKTSPEKRESLRKFMTTLGGNNTGDRVRRILYHLLSDEVAVCFNWTGTGSKEKFQSLQLTAIMLSSLTTPPAAATASDIEKVTQTWLRHANERLQKKKSHSGTSATC
ncbi:uncharacterized protein LOC135369202 isoform X1 [Ornithodoros turicata]|uniref:uncharacterized protein LOC135369202 isoform X1 n=1 Tax=Ornithodoros turicata TaxID=34597 RepID=UPI0031395A3F